MSDILERAFQNLLVLLVLFLGAVAWAFFEAPLARWWRGGAEKGRRKR